MNCKPGDLAYLSSECVDEGVVVEVLRPAEGCELPAWHVRSRTALKVSYQRSGREGFETEVVVEDRYLRPISGVPVGSDEPAQVNIGEAVNLAWGFKPREFA